MSVNYGLILTTLTPLFGPIVLGVLAIAVVLTGFYVVIFGLNRWISFIRGDMSSFAKRYEREAKKERLQREKAKRDPDDYEDYRVRRERRLANRGW